MNYRKYTFEYVDAPADYINSWGVHDDQILRVEIVDDLNFDPPVTWVVEGEIPDHWTIPDLFREILQQAEEETHLPAPGPVFGLEWRKKS